jgi:hypothetical protein
MIQAEILVFRDGAHESQDKFFSLVATALILEKREIP